MTDSQSNIKFEEPEIMDYETEDIKKGVKLILKDGSILEAILEVTHVIKVGYDTNNGAPVYNVVTQTIIKTKSIPKELFKKPNPKSPTGYQ
jgi:hypothetical protein